MSRSLGLLAVLATMLGVSAVMAEQPVIQMPTAPKFPLFLEPAVRKELQFTPEQERKVEEALGAISGGGEEGGGGRITIRIGPGGGGADELPDFKKIEKDLLAILDAKQKERFKQIWLQRHGAQCLADAEVAKDLNLNDAQKDLVKDIQDQHQEEMQKLMREAFQGGGDGGAFRIDEKKLKELRDRTEKNTLEILTKEQTEQWEKLMGPKFEPKKS